MMTNVARNMKSVAGDRVLGTTRPTLVQRMLLPKHEWESDRSGTFAFRRCNRCALLEEKNTHGRTTYTRGGGIVAVIGRKDKQPPCR